MRQYRRLLVVCCLALSPPLAAAQERLPITATAGDVERVHLTFATMSVLTERCIAETGESEAFTAAHADWQQRNGRLLRLADGILAYLGAHLDEAALLPRAEADTDDLLTSIVPRGELCHNYLAKITAGEMDVPVLVPDLNSRIVTSDGTIAAQAEASGQTAPLEPPPGSGAETHPVPEEPLHPGGDATHH